MNAETYHDTSYAQMRVEITTPAAVEWMETTSRASVLHIFSNACNLINQRGDVLSIVTRRTALGPFSMLVEQATQEEHGNFSFTDYVNLRLPVRLSESEISIGKLSVQPSRARLWNPRISWEHIRYGRIYSTLPMIELVLSRYGPQQSSDSLLIHQRTGSVAGRLNECLEKLASGLQNNARSEIIASAAELAGMGSGLTPAGDDFLVGLIYAMWIRDGEEARSMVVELAASAAQLTTHLSAAWLKSAAEGEAGIFWHDFLAAASGEDETEIEATVRRLIAVGHTSGADALAGFIWTMQHLSQVNSVSTPDH